jgi:hypothetical protein
MASNSSYGVFTKETDLSQRISIASSTIGVIVGESPKGPVGERTLITDTSQLASVFGKRHPKHKFGLYAAHQFLQEASQLYFTRITNGALYAGAYLTVDDPSANVPHIQLTVFDNGSNQPLGLANPQDVAWTPATPGIENILCMFFAKDPGLWNNRISIQISPSNPRGLAIGHSAHNVLDFFVDVYLDYTGPSDLSVERFLVSREQKANENGDQMYIEDVINNGSNYIRVRNNVLCQQVEIRESAFEFFDGASDGANATVDQLIDAWDLYSDTDEVLCNLFINAGYSDPLIQGKMDQVARARGDSFCILDLPSTEQDTVDAIVYRRNTLNLNSSYSGIYTPDLYVLDDANNIRLYVPPSGHVAGIFARTDRERALWIAPAGVRRGGLNILNLKHRYKQGARDALAPAQINPIRSIPSYGYVLFDQLTLQSIESAFSFVNIRRLFNFVKSRIATTAKSGVFEPNDEMLRAFLTQICNDFLNPIMQERALYEFSVVCDERNNTNATIANGDVMLDVYADPVIATRRIHITANVTATGASFFEE